jgi:hypothetical protein
MIKTNSQDGQEIERLLDFMLDFCFDEDMLLLYRRLCRHLHFLDPISAVEYAYAYRERYDETYIPPEETTFRTPKGTKKPRRFAPRSEP